MENKPLTNKQRVFVEEYLRDFNATQAAIRTGYSPRTANEQGSRLLSYVSIKEAIAERIAQRRMSADEVLDKLSDIARGDMGDFLDVGSMGFSIDLNKAKEAGKLHLLKKVKMRTTTTLSKEGVETETHDIDIELYDKVSVLEKMGRHHKLFTDKTELSGSVEVFDVEYVDDTE